MTYFIQTDLGTVNGIDGKPQVFTEESSKVQVTLLKATGQYKAVDRIAL